jgi:ArsR family transcriptional regulator
MSATRDLPPPSASASTELVVAEDSACEGIFAVTRLCQALSDPTRVRLLALLRAAPMHVAELTQVTGLPQPRVSTHLQRLREVGLVSAQRQGNLSLYQPSLAALAAPERGLVTAALAAAEGPQLEADRTVAQLLVAQRAGGEPAARRYVPGRSWEALGRGLAQWLQLGDLIDLGAGDGGVAALLAGQARSVICVERDPEIIAAAHARGPLPPQLRYLQADLCAVPLPEACADHALMLGVLPMLAEPEAALREALRLLRPGGRLLLSTLARHAHPEAVLPFGHQNNGQDVDELRAMLRAAGFVQVELSRGAREHRPPHFLVLNAVARRAPLEPR